MAFILAIETDARQAGILTRVVRRQLGARLAVVSSKHEALATIAAGVPDLVLLSALLSPRDEEEIVAHLRSLEGAAHLQTLTIPRLADPEEGQDEGRWRIWRRRPTADPAAGCDPQRFGEEIAEYLARARALKTACTTPAVETETTGAVEVGGPVGSPVTSPGQEREAHDLGGRSVQSHETRAAGRPADPDAVPVTGRSGAPPATPAAASPASSPPLRCAPLAIWARHLPAGGAARADTPPARRDPTPVADALLASLLLPKAVADAGIRDCRIRRVVVARRPIADRSRREDPPGDERLHAVA